MASFRYTTGPLTLGGAADFFTELISVATSITNTGRLRGAEVAQLYVTFPDAVAQPICVLRGHEKGHNRCRCHDFGRPMELTET